MYRCRVSLTNVVLESTGGDEIEQARKAVELQVNETNSALAFF
jgi:hypothetical protein